VSDGGRFVVCASNGGAPKNPHCYDNLKARPDATIEVLTDTIEVRASEAQGEERDRLWRASVQNAFQLGEYAQQSGRTIPVIVLTPRELR
jgi:deazaflavin-dependent oxidoreductase (nitroreductase family)